MRQTGIIDETTYMATKKIWKIIDLINTTAQYFKDKHIENPRLNAEQLLAKILNMQRVDLYVAYDRPLAPPELDAYRGLVRRRAAGEPLQYILQETEFMGLPFKVSPAALIPRPETEILVEQVLELKKTAGLEKPSIVDIGTGSGCIAVSLAKLWPESQIWAGDISDEALHLAEENARLNEVSDRIRFQRYDVFQPWLQEFPSAPDIIVSNPPYIALAEMNSLAAEVRDFEPQTALTDNADGLSFYRRILQLATENGAPVCAYLFLELSGVQPQKIAALAEDYPFAAVSIINDLNDIARVLKIEVTHE